MTAIAQELSQVVGIAPACEARSVPLALHVADFAGLFGGALGKLLHRRKKSIFYQTAWL